LARICQQVTDVIFRQTPRYQTPWQVSLIVTLALIARVDFRARAARARRGGGDVSAAIIAADHVSKWYGQVIGLNDVSVSVPPGITGCWARTAPASRRS
jgi:hypothetical protein